jgi:mono/diheme cytochrome c family protein
VISRTAGVAAALALGLGVMAAAGCGGDPGTESADLEAGKTTFTAACSSCHTLEAAGTPASNIGPNLDDAFRAARQVGMDEDQFAGVVEKWVSIAQQPMPRDLVTGQDKTNVAAYIASVAGTSPDSAVRPAPPWPGEAPDPARQDQAPPGE